MYPLPYAAPPFSCGAFFFKVPSAASGQSGQGKGKLLRLAWAVWSLCRDDGLNELDLQTAFHVLVQTFIGTSGFVVERPGTQLVYITRIVPQDLLHSFGVSGSGSIALPL